MDDTLLFTPRPLSLIVTTWGTDTYYTQACLEAIACWKRPHHTLIVAVHDESALLRAYLEARLEDRLIDRLAFTVSGHGHTRSFNLGVQYASGDVVFNIGNDILIGPSLVDDCAYKLRNNPRLGLIGWHWYNEGTFWRDGRLAEYRLRNPQQPFLSPQDEQNIRNAPWFTGRTFEGLGGPKWLCLCNTSFFGVRRDVLQRIGGGFGPQYRHYWADDLLNYAVLDQDLDIQHFERKFRERAFFHEFQYDNTEVADRHRHADRLTCERPCLDSAKLLQGGMSQDELIFLHLLASAVPDGASVVNVGVWRGASALVLLDALRHKRATFHFIDAFDLPGLSEMSGQPPVSREEFLKGIEPYVGSDHTVYVTRANTLDLARFPKADFLFLDAGHTEQCISHDARLVRECLTGRGVAAFHDYGCPSWPAVKPELDRLFAELDVYQTTAVHRRVPVRREEYLWPEDAVARE